ncbi:MAG: efflux RND transporter periplasmic adaptor subunit [Paracoccaceae bacterium]
MHDLTRPFSTGLRRAAALTVGALLAFGTAAQADSAQAEAAQVPDLPVVSVTDAARAEMVGRVAISGTLVATQEVLIYPQVSGYTIEALMVDTGDRVNAGDVLAHLNDRTLKAQRAQAEAELARAKAAIGQAESQIRSAEASAAQARTAYTRAKALFDRGASTQASLDQAAASAQTAEATLASARDGLIVAQAQEQTAKAALEIAALNLDHATLKSPASGTISARNGQIGAIASTGGEPIFRLIKDSSVELEAEVIETALGEISKGDTAQLQIAGIGAATGIVRRLPATVDATSRLGILRVTVAAQEGLRPGIFASGWIITEQREAITVPTQAVMSDAGGSAVFVVKDGILERRAVTAGLIWQGRREIAQGLSEGEVVVAKAGAFFGDGDAITPARAGEGAAK